MRCDAFVTVVTRQFWTAVPHSTPTVESAAVGARSVIFISRDTTRIARRRKQRHRRKTAAAAAAAGGSCSAARSL